MSKAYSSENSAPMLVQFGNWIFHLRNYLFPLFYMALFIPSGKIFENRIVSDILGLFFIFSGLMIRSITVGLAYVVKGGKNRRIYAEHLVTTGIYSMCRNPLYLGNIFLLLGFGLFADSLLFMLVFFPLFLFVYYAIMKAEEAFLLNKFGSEFAQYRSNINMLIPDFRKLRIAFTGQNFDLKKAIRKEYNPISIYLTGILLLLLVQERISWKAFVVSFIILLVAYLVIKILKRRNKLI